MLTLLLGISDRKGRGSRLTASSSRETKSTSFSLIGLKAFIHHSPEGSVGINTRTVWKDAEQRLSHPRHEEYKT
jgi:hypothetical protein